jgi:DNA-binding YbaB/EbfC family protein
MPFNPNTDPGALLKQAQKMQRDLMKLKDSLAERVVEGQAGGGKVIAAVNGNKELISLKIQKDIVDPEDVDLLEDLILTAVNQGLKEAANLNEREMSKVTGGLNIPGLF